MCSDHILNSIAIILHGFAEHSYYYCNLAEQCALKGIVVYAPDHGNIIE